MSRKRLHYRKIVHCGACVLRRVLYILFKHYYYTYTGVQAAYYCNNYNTMFLHLQHFQKSYDKKQKKVFNNYHYLKKENHYKEKKKKKLECDSVLISNLFEAWAIITGVTLCMKCFSYCGFDIVVIKLFSYFSYKFLNHIY